MDTITYYLDPGVEYKISMKVFGEMSLVLSSLSILKIYKLSGLKNNLRLWSTKK